MCVAARICLQGGFDPIYLGLPLAALVLPSPPLFENVKNVELVEHMGNIGTRLDLLRSNNFAGKSNAINCSIKFD